MECQSQTNKKITDGSLKKEDNRCLPFIETSVPLKTRDKTVLVTLYYRIRLLPGQSTDQEAFEDRHSAEQRSGPDSEDLRAKSESLVSSVCFVPFAVRQWDPVHHGLFL